MGVRAGTSLDALRAAVAHVVEGRAFASFRITARRAFKTLPYTSVELNRHLGAHVLSLRPARVDLTRPELNVFVEVVPGQAFVYAGRRPGPGGLPVGTGGTVAALLSGGIDSPVAAWRLMKRGARVVFVHFHSVPYLARHLPAQGARAGGDAHRVAACLTAVPGAVRRHPARGRPRRPRRRRAWSCTGASWCASRRRSPGSVGAAALVTGESLGQVASQTLENLARIDEVAAMPVLRPLIGMDKLEITEQARAIGTFATSIEPDADCCTLFVPRHPDTAVNPGEVRRLEARLDIDGLVGAGAALAREERFAFPPGVDGAGRPGAAGRRDPVPPRSVRAGGRSPRPS